MTKTKLDLSKTKYKEQVSKYGIYYLNIKKVDNYASSFRLYIQKKINGEYYPLQKTAYSTYDLVEYKAPISWPTTKYENAYNILLPYITMLRVIKEKAFPDIFHKIIADKINKTKDKTLSGIIYHHCDFFQDYIWVIKEYLGMDIAFEDIEEILNVEFRERALKKFGYEKYVKEGFKNNKIEMIMLKKGVISEDMIYPTCCFSGEYYGYAKNIDRINISTLFRELKNKYLYEKEKIIIMENDISFLQVKDSSSDKIYFLKIPHDIRDIQEAKAWTFGLNESQYNPMVEA